MNIFPNSTDALTTSKGEPMNRLPDATIGFFPQGEEIGVFIGFWNNLRDHTEPVPVDLDHFQSFSLACVAAGYEVTLRQTTETGVPNCVVVVNKGYDKQAILTALDGFLPRLKLTVKGVTLEIPLNFDLDGQDFEVSVEIDGIEDTEEIPANSVAGIGADYVVFVGSYPDKSAMMFGVNLTTNRFSTTEFMTFKAMNVMLLEAKLKDIPVKQFTFETVPTMLCYIVHDPTISSFRVMEHWRATQAKIEPLLAVALGKSK